MSASNSSALDYSVIALSTSPRPGIYELRLHFAETAFGPDLSGSGAEGSRLMTIRINGKTILAGLDVAADTGASRTADVKVFPGIRPADDGLSLPARTESRPYFQQSRFCLGSGSRFAPYALSRVNRLTTHAHGGRRAE